METQGMKVGLLTAGGDCPGLNAAIRGFGKTAMLHYGMRLFGFSSGFTGLINNDFIELSENQLSGILTEGGTILGTSREKPYKKTRKKDGTKVLTKPEKIIQTYENLELDCLVCMGGNGTQRTANLLAEEGLNVIGIPKTIDNDVWGTDISFGFDSAFTIASEAIDRLHSTANSHNRTMIIEVMGHRAGWLALYSGLAAGGDLILIPEIPFTEENIVSYLAKRHALKKNYSIVVVAEGISPNKNITAAKYVSGIINKGVGIETRDTILGYVQRGGTPTPFDRILATRYGAKAAEMIAMREFGRMVALDGQNLTSIPLSEAGSRARLVDPDSPLVNKARHIGTSFGD